MSRAGTLARAIGSDGILNVADVNGLAAVASSGSATDLTTGTLANARLAAGAAVANLGYTPANKAGDTFTGIVTSPQIRVGNASAQSIIGKLYPYDALAYNDGSNSTVADTGTATGYAVKRASGAASNGWFYGPYDDIAPGNYVAKFRLKVASNASSSVICYIDCAGSNITSNPAGIQNRNISPNNFAASGVWQYFNLFFTKTVSGGYIETRGLSFVTGITDIYIDHILIQPM